MQVRPGASDSDEAFEEIPRCSLEEGTVVLGVPIGNASFVDTFVDDVCRKLTHMAERIGLMKSNIAKFLLLRACFGACRINHLLRSLPFKHAKSLAEKSSVVVRNLLDDILVSPLPDICFLLACLPVRNGWPVLFLLARICFKLSFFWSLFPCERWGQPEPFVYLMYFC